MGCDERIWAFERASELLRDDADLFDRIKLANWILAGGEG